MSKIIRVVATITLDVDATAWAEAYGRNGSAEIRADVKEYIRQNVAEHFRDMGLLDTHGQVLV